MISDTQGLQNTFVPSMWWPFPIIFLSNEWVHRELYKVSFNSSQKPSPHFPISSIVCSLSIHKHLKEILFFHLFSQLIAITLSIHSLPLSSKTSLTPLVFIFHTKASPFSFNHIQWTHLSSLAGMLISLHNHLTILSLLP